MNKNNFISLWAILALLTLGLSAQAQDDYEIGAVSQNFDFAFGVGFTGSKPIYATSLAFNRNHGVLKSKRLRLGYGLRLLNFASSDLLYITAPARLTGDAATIDTLVVKSPLSFSANAHIHIEYLIIDRLKVGFNIDVVGIGFGAKSSTIFTSSDNTGQFPLNPEAKPYLLNLLLIGDRDLGQLGSEFYLGFAISPRFWLRGGLGFIFNEYQTTQKLTQDNDRFRHKALVPFLALSYNPF